MHHWERKEMLPVNYVGFIVMHLIISSEMLKCGKVTLFFTNERWEVKGSAECLLCNDSTRMTSIEQFAIKKSKHKTILFHFHCFVCFIFIINVIANYRKLQGKPSKLCMRICGILGKSWWWKQNPEKYTIPTRAVFCFYCIKRRFFKRL